MRLAPGGDRWMRPPLAPRWSLALAAAISLALTLGLASGTADAQRPTPLPVDGYARVDGTFFVLLFS